MANSIVIIPTYNEKENVEKIIRKVFSLPKDFEVLIIDDGSPDGTASIVKQLTEVNSQISSTYLGKEREIRFGYRLYYRL